MKIECHYDFTIKIYEKGNCENVKIEKDFVDMLDLVSFTNKIERKYDDCCIEVINNSVDADDVECIYDTKCVYDGCLHIFNRNVDAVLMNGDYS